MLLAVMLLIQLQKQLLIILALFFSRALAGKVYVNSIAPGLMKAKLTKKFKEDYFKIPGQNTK